MSCKKSFPESFADVEMIYRNRKVWSVLPLWKKCLSDISLACSFSHRASDLPQLISESAVAAKITIGKRHIETVVTYLRGGKYVRTATFICYGIAISPTT